MTVMHAGISRTIYVGGPSHLLCSAADRVIALLEQGIRKGRDVSRDFESAFLHEGRRETCLWRIGNPCGIYPLYVGFDAKCVIAALGLKPGTFMCEPEYI